MRTVTTIDEFRREVDRARLAGATVGFVPTMGFLHAGHMSLVERARGENGFVAVSIFVNPAQFAPTEDLDAYPRGPERDVAMLESAGVGVLFAPAVEEMYPEGFATTVEVTGELTEILCGASRAGHFKGVTTVVAKLFAVTAPCTAYFGQKDFQQLIVVKRMARDLDFAVTVVSCPTVREPDGLALSSRNAYLTEAQRAIAPALRWALAAAAQVVSEGEEDPRKVESVARAVLDDEPLWQVEYVQVRDAQTLGAVESIVGPVVIAGAGRLGKARLIDNVVVAPGTLG